MITYNNPPATTRQRLYIFCLMEKIGHTLYDWCGYTYEKLTYEQANEIIPILKEDAEVRRC